MDWDEEEEIPERDHMENVKMLVEKIREADAILIGAASGLSSAGGQTFYYLRDDIFINHFSEYEKKYGYHSAFGGLYFPYHTDSERWAFLAELIHLIFETPTLEPYCDLYELLLRKEYMILTTNQDRQFRDLFPGYKISAIQGDWGYLQCSRPCHDQVYPSEEIIYKLHENIKDLKAPEEMIPRCPKCGALMEPWVRGYNFLEGSKYVEECMKWTNFVTLNKDKKILFLELGVGRMTPEFIQHPFWKMVSLIPNAFYITINWKHAILPKPIKDKGFAIKEDIAKVLHDAVPLMEEYRKKDPKPEEECY